MAGPLSSRMIMQTLRRAAGVAQFDRDTCRDILFDPRAIYQVLAVLVAGLAAAILRGIAVQVHAVRHAFDSESTLRASILVVAIWALQSALGYTL